MEQWTELRNDGRGNAKGNFWFDFDLDFRIEKYRFNPCKERLRSLFDKVLNAFMQEKSTSNCIRPIPALCGDGRPVDLFKLFWVVRKIGGHDVVSRNNLWGFVSVECGLGFGVVPSIKLIYMKYLNELDQWLRQVVSKRSLEHEYGELVQELDLLSCELETKSTSLSSDEQEEQEKDSEFVKDTKDREEFILDISENELHLSTNGGISGHVDNTIYLFNEDEKLCSGNDHSRLSTGTEHIICKVRGVHSTIDTSISDFAAATKRLVEKAVNETNGFSKGQIDDEFSVQDDNDVCISAKKVVKKVISKTDDLSENIIDDDEKVGVQPKSDVGNVLESRKRKRESESSSGMLNWLIHVAKRPDDPSVGKIPECSKWGDYGNEELWVQAMLVREALLIRRQANTNAGENLLKDKQKKHRMHPSMYEVDVLDHQSTEKLRCSKRVPTLTKSHFCPCCNSNASAQSKDTVHQEANKENSPKAPQSKDTIHQEANNGNSPKTPQSKDTVHQETNKGNSPKAPVKLVVIDVKELPPTNSYVPNPPDVPTERQVSVGPLFQAEVPEWTGVISESDSKWLGTRMWPFRDGDENSTVKLDPVGKGSQHRCDCPFPNSVECVRFHTAEKRLKLKQELGLLFYRWRFDRMGEEVSLSWTEEEEKRFKDMMRSYAAFPNKFWRNASRFLPSKRREKLVSYYFNVFLVQRRSYQNRVTPKDVDSDDDEKQCGSIGGCFGYKSLYVPGSSSVLCTLNKQSTELV
ncbi:hypothetical protein DH2020_036241 [Rehmannia glutinosa]|uniref:ARID domain-containing protein n=1 Tax=Rehmannia glutinosa TaxID=99300 RepID=A0ABR0V7D7_REHGL